MRCGKKETRIHKTYLLKNYRIQSSNVFVVDATGRAPGCQWCWSVREEFYLASQDVGHLSTINHVPLVMGNIYCDAWGRLIASTQPTAEKCG